MLVGGLSSLALAGCRLLQDSIDAPVASYPFRDDRSSDTLLVIVPGATDRPEDLEQNGVVELLRERGCEYDIVVPYRLGPSYLLGDVEDELHLDVLRYGPRERRVWLAISAGALVTFGFARSYGEEVDRIIAYAPYLGPEKIIGEIEAEGGLASWTANEPIEDIERVWTWLRGYAEPEQAKSRPRLDLMWGRNDPGARAQELLAAVLPEDRVHPGPGEHGWVTFMGLLRAFVDAHPPSDW